MSCPRPIVCLAPLSTARLHSRTPSILLCGQHQPTLLRCLDGWPRRNGKAAALAIQFVEAGQDLAGFADDRFDLAVVQSPKVGDAATVIGHLTRIARQGLLRL
ncbi:class I SAM-dependent methyltransferase [Pseudomonas typographi]|uniref:Class I SAM-dependent methyltransferase n=1 Tax=Pseudomonas typographi TaxID=2715964 RepID=A0ABR7Z0S3_9PSED|nr:class I SAM-dependent methyltransferase [Pseudomonas typographi]MBD1588720.1 class I SAM-dependent methyltransferase [Pseudomonas typographi]MBD1599060.1 class I SAM-dependent methyltransferase [Pseudomonas typographi]